VITTEQIGQAALDMHRKRRAVEKWMHDEATQLRLVTAGQAPMWEEYKAAERVLADLLNETTREVAAGLTDADNPRCFCPDCGADLGYFYSNRIRMERR